MLPLKTSRSLLITLLYILMGISCIWGQGDKLINKRVYKTQDISSLNKPNIDGKLDDAVWKLGNWADDFVQRQPQENTTPSVTTAFKIVYDEKYIYVAIKNNDPNPASISKRMSRRDQLLGDWVEILIDCNGDFRTANALAVTAAGVKVDKYIYINGEAEDSWWNPIWYVATSVDEEGWKAEMKIPFSQLRFGKSRVKQWGLQLRRKYFANEETSVWQRVPLDAPGWVSEFGILSGLDNIKIQRALEIQPYVVSSLQTFKKDANNPFKIDYNKSISAGLDGKWGVTNDLILDFTINPDFGQVEADPSAIALDGFQLFFAEQRPFFVENKDIFNYQFSTPKIGSRYNNDNLFYSRRIGGKPKGSYSLLDGEFAESPNQTTILGAAKFGGKTQNGWSIGIMEAATASEYAEIKSTERIRKTLVEPLTNYFVARVQKDLNERNTFIGGIFTNTLRDLDANLSSVLHKNASTICFDFLHQWNDRNYYLGANIVGSQVKGTTAAILGTQLSIPHLFQKTDTDHLSVDSSRTSLIGTGGDIKIGKAGNGRFTFETGITWRSPELELNDLGFMREADVIFNYTGVDYNIFKPFGAFRRAAIAYKHWIFTDFGGLLNYIDWDVEISGQFQNNYTARLGFFQQPYVYSRTLLQGGPRMKLPEQYGFWWGMRTDERKALSASFNGWMKTGGGDAYNLLENSLQITYQPVDRFNISMTPRYTYIDGRLQYVNNVHFNDDSRFITAHLRQKTLSLALRINYTINPNFTVQYYGQPFITTGTYKNFNYVNNAGADRQSEQLAFYGPEQLKLNISTDNYHVDEDLNGIVDYSFENPAFSFAQFQSNLVLRYEYRPNSEIFLVWAQGLTEHTRPQDRFIEDIRNQLFGRLLENNFLLKITYRFF